MRIKKLISEYKDADFNKRLNMYLEFSELREAFLDIDQNENIKKDLLNANSPENSTNLIEIVSRFVNDVFLKSKYQNH